MSDVSKSSNQSSKSSNAIDEAVIIDSTDQAKPPKDSKQNKTGALWFFTLLNLLIVLALVAGAYWYYSQIHQNTSQENSALKAVESALDDTKTQQNQLAANVKNQATQLNNEQAALLETVNELKQELESLASVNEGLGQRVAEMSGRRPSDWLLAEANYLVNMAGRKLYLEKDVETAFTLLSEADQRLVDLNDPSLFPIRKQLASDMQALQQVSLVSSSSVALEISGLSALVKDLPMDTLRLPEADADENTNLSEDVSDWRQNLAKTWRSIVGDFISIKHVDAPLEPYLAERQQWLIEEQIKHALAQAQTAVLNEQEALFKSAIQTAMTGVADNYLLDDNKVANFLESLQNLQNTNFTQDMPNKIEAQASLKRLIEQRIQSLYNSSLSPSVEAQNDEEGTAQ
ncbi:uroporphyrinogen-III C-methyltransferase [Glaciecola sp. 2405UD65-10]|uniref:uroporphyrinogen-III C-methyltransferase n=1 Tax=Glaciecola sp. 2405UD65-10 TaxID=3397244 RepID=UPI003B59E59F